MKKRIITSVLKKEEKLEWTCVSCLREHMIKLDEGVIPFEWDENSKKLSTEKAFNEVVHICKKNRSKEVILLVTPADSLIRVFHLPAIDPTEIRMMSRLQMEKLSPFPSDELTINAEIIHNIDDGTSIAMAVAIKTEILENFRSVFTNAGIYPVYVTVTSFALIEGLKEFKFTAIEGNNLFIIQDNNCWLVIPYRNGIPLSFNVISNLPESAEESFIKSFLEELEHIFISMEINNFNIFFDNISILYSKELPQSTITAIKDNLSPTVQFKNIPHELSIPEISCKKYIEKKEGTYPLNLAPESWLEERRSMHVKSKTVKAIAGVVMIWLFIVGLAETVFYFKIRTLKELEQEAQKWNKPALEVRTIRSKIYALTKYINRDRSILEALLEITTQMPPTGIKLTSFLYKKSAGVKISAEADNVSLVYNFRKNLESSKLLSVTDMKGPLPDSQKGVEKFDLDMKFKGEE